MWEHSYANVMRQAHHHDRAKQWVLDTSEEGVGAMGLADIAKDINTFLASYSLICPAG